MISIDLCFNLRSTLATAFHTFTGFHAVFASQVSDNRIVLFFEGLDLLGGEHSQEDG